MIQNQQASAQIYQFPIGGRAGLRQIFPAQRAARSSLNPPRGGALDAGEAWYHAEAIDAANDVKPA